MEKQYLCIDLKSFYASVECVERNLDPLTTNLVVADIGRTEKTICLAVTPSLKSFGISGRARLFEVVGRVREVNYERRQKAPHRRLEGKSFDYNELKANPSLALDYIAAPPRMALYMEYSTKIYKEVYLKYVSKDDIHVYSIDEVFMDLTGYLKYSKMTAHEMAIKIIREILKLTGITATAGIGTNLYLAKVAMDITAKKMPADKDGVRIAYLDEMTYRKELWEHRPLTDFWRIGKGYSSKLEALGIYTMGDVAKCSVGDPTQKYNEDLLYKLFGVNAELLIDHAWGWEPCTIADIKSYKPASNSLSSGQVLQCPYSFEKARLIVKEMTDMLVLDLVDKNLVTDQIVLIIGYDSGNLSDPKIRIRYSGEITIDHYGRPIPKHSHGTANLGGFISSTKKINESVMCLFDRIVNRDLFVRRINITANHVIPKTKGEEPFVAQQLDLFTDYEALERRRKKEKEAFERENKLQKALLSVKKKYGKNTILKGMNYIEGATAKDRNAQIGGHRA
ncbi:MAG: DNA methylase [Ruminococcaceae bacterium]|nr:DNA methylase [Oscillospiraceae bacterium]